MLVLTRRPSESIVIADNIKITVVSVGPGRVKLGIEAPQNVRIDRQEIHDKIEQATDVLLAVAGGEASSDAQNTMIGHGPDTAAIVIGAPSPESTETPAPAPAAPPKPAQNSLNRFRKPR
jgi:carbon storage regulator